MALEKGRRMTHRRLLVAGFMLVIGCQGKGFSGPGSISQGESIEPASAALNGPDHARWTVADDLLIAPIWTGDDDHGSLYLPLWRNAVSAIEDYIPAPANGDCSKMKGTLRVDWDRAANTVHFAVKFRGIIPHPVVHRTEGVDWTFNPFHQTPKDFGNTGYRFWTLFGRINTGPLTTFYYDPATLLLLGSEWDFPNGPPNNGAVIPVQFPIFPIIPSKIFLANEDGSAFHEWTVPYDHVTAEGGAVSFSPNSFIPLDLCEAAPLQPTISQLRPYISDWRPASEGPSWAEILHAGPIFDTTVDPIDFDGPGGVFPYPYIYSDASLMSNVAGMQGGVPNNYFFHIPSAIQNVTPPLRPVPGGNGVGCFPHYHDPHVSAPRYCEMAH